MDFTPADAAKLEVLRAILSRQDTIIAGQHDILAALTSPPTHANGHSAQLPLDPNTNGHAKPKLQRGVSIDPKGHPAYVASFTLDDGRRKRIRVPIVDHGDDALKFANIVLDVLKGRDRERNLARLPEKLRMKVMLELLPE